MQNQIIDSVIIRKAEEQDFEQILNIENQVAIDPWPKEIFISCAALYNAVVVTVEQVIVGYGVVAIYNSIDESHKALAYNSALKHPETFCFTFAILKSCSARLRVVF